MIFSIIIVYGILKKYNIKTNKYMNLLLIFIAVLYPFYMGVFIETTINKNEDLTTSIEEMYGDKMEHRYSEASETNEAIIREEEKKEEEEKLNSKIIPMMNLEKTKPKQIILDNSINNFIEDKIKIYHDKLNSLHDDLDFNRKNIVEEINDSNNIEDNAYLIDDENNNINILLNEKKEKMEDILNCLKKKNNMNVEDKIVEKKNLYNDFNKSNSTKKNNKLDSLKHEIKEYKEINTDNHKNYLNKFEEIIYSDNNSEANLDELKEEARIASENINYDVEMHNLNYKNYMHYKKLLYERVDTYRHFLPFSRETQD